MTPDAAIAALDRALAIAGSWATLRRTSGAVRAPLEVAIRVRFTGADDVPLAGPLIEQAVTAVFGPSEAAKAQFPFPPEPGDEIEAEGRVRAIDSVDVQRLGGVIVRVNARLRG